MPQHISFVCLRLQSVGFGWQDTHDAYNTCGKLRLGTERVICGLDVIACERRVTQRLALARLEMSSTLRSGPGGNSLFEAFSQAVWGAPHYHTLLRQMIIKYMREDEDARAEYQTILGDDYDAYLTWMQQQGTAGDELTLRVLADRFGLPVTVITGDEVVWCVRYPPRRCRSKREIFLVSVPTGRFAAIRRQSAITTIRLTLTSSHEEKRVKEQRKKLTPYGAGALSATA